MKNGFIKVATAFPCVRLADCAYNKTEAVRLAKEAAEAGVGLLVFPELSLTGATCGDLFYTTALLNSAEKALEEFLTETGNLDLVSVVGLPVRLRDRLYNCAAVCCSGRLLGLVPKVNVPNSGDAYEGRCFASAPEETDTCLMFSNCYAEFGAKQLFSSHTCCNLTFAVAVGGFYTGAVDPAVNLARAGATVICCPSATPETVGAADARRRSAVFRSEQNLCACLYANAGRGESTSDAVYAGHSVITENGEILAEHKPFADGELLVTEIDIERLMYLRRKQDLFVPLTKTERANYYENLFELPVKETVLTRFVDPSPVVSHDPVKCAEECEAILSIQSHALAERIERAYCKKAVIGISGGLDSTLALLVAARAMDILSRPRTDVLGITMPGFGTTSRTKGNAEQLCEALGVDLRCIPIGDAVSQHFRDIGHDPEMRDVTYENSQARERTQILMDVSNEEGGMVIGTGDFSELALGWATYNGDQMSMYSVNASLPKTLIRYVVSFAADDAEKNGEAVLASVLRDILATPVSPELLPADEKGNIAQKTEDLVGPYELHDFYLYQMLCNGASPEKLYRLAKQAFGDAYSDRELLHWLETLLRRFFSQQFKRSCSPEGVKAWVTSLSPRADLRMPGDAVSEVWLAEVAALKARL